MTIQEMKNRKTELGYTNEDIASLSGVPLSTVNKIFGGTTSAPRRSTLLALESVLSSGSHTPYPHASVNYQTLAPITGIVAEPDVPYQTGTSPTLKQPGDYTLEDYLALPDDQRVELIDGVFYDMAAPGLNHQFIAIQIGHQLMGHIDRNKGNCKPVLSPVDVQLDRDNKTVVQPDVMILCKPDTIMKNGRVFGAPDLVMEILSPSTRKKDMSLKLYKYTYAGVREYWIIDPKKFLVTVYDLEHEEPPVLYSFKNQVPVGIWNNEFSVDFQAVLNYMVEFSEEDTDEDKTQDGRS